MVQRGMRLEEKGLDEAIEFVDSISDDLNKYFEEVIDKTARKAMEPRTESPYSIKGRNKRIIPRDTGRLMAVFGAIDGSPNTGYILDHRRAKAKSDTTYEEDVIWEKIGRLQIDMGTTLWYASIVVGKNNFLATYAHTVSGNLRKYAQGLVDRFILKKAKEHFRK